jgi:hypothetical protein
MRRKKPPGGLSRLRGGGGEEGSDEKKVAVDGNGASACKRALAQLHYHYLVTFNSLLHFQLWLASDTKTPSFGHFRLRSSKVAVGSPGSSCFTRVLGISAVFASHSLEPGDAPTRISFTL